MVVNWRCTIPGNSPGSLRHLEYDLESDFLARIVVGELAISLQSILWRFFAISCDLEVYFPGRINFWQHSAPLLGNVARAQNN